MTTKQSGIAVVWLKRDFRLRDHGALHQAISSHQQLVLLYVCENSLRKEPHSSERHFDFIKQSISDLNRQLIPFNTKVLALKGEVIPVLDKLHRKINVAGLYSHLETGIDLTFKRDKNVQKWCTENNIPWKEERQQGVFRGMQNRKEWIQQWSAFMNMQQFPFPQKNAFLPTDRINDLLEDFISLNLNTKLSSLVQPGGEQNAHRYMDSFFNGRYTNYQTHISKPDLARKSCSRLSPYLAFGNLSMRQVLQRTEAEKERGKRSRGINAFESRLRWQAHFIQKFEMECRMEFESVNRGYHRLKKEINPLFINAWENGLTGVPMVDAAMRCLVATGYLNFRMRALVVSFFVHQLWQPWQACSAFLAQQFLDFEPGIHFPQLQMQAGETGINTLRIYNPVKNGLTHDPKGLFTKKWIPELAELPDQLVHTPWDITPFEEEMYGFRLGTNYPHPIVDIDQRRKEASDILWKMQKDPLVYQESKRILSRHTLARRKSNRSA